MKNSQRKTKTGYAINNNGMPIDKIGVNPLSSEALKDNQIPKTKERYTKIGKFKPTVHNISEI